MPDATLGATGIRISELPFITVEAAKERRAVITMKGKTRIVPLGDDLCLLLLAYAKEAGIETGSLFITRNKNPMDRSNIRREMKALSKEAGVPREKIFPHNFRHMFACAFYQKTKDAVRLADILGHASVNTTRIYTTISLSEQAREINGLGLIIRQTQKERRRKKKRKRRRSRYKTSPKKEQIPYNNPYGVKHKGFKCSGGIMKKKLK